MSEETDRLRRVLLAAAGQFAAYASYHLAKQPPDTEKAKTNLEWAARCCEAAGE
jgi:hypothetical protein